MQSCCFANLTYCLFASLLGSSGHKKKRAREKETREGRGSACTEGPRKSFPAPSPLACLPRARAPVLSFARYFQAGYLFAVLLVISIMSPAHVCDHRSSSLSIST